MAEARCRTCDQPMKACQCPIPPLPDVLGHVVELQQAERARRITPVALLMGYAD